MYSLLLSSLLIWSVSAPLIQGQPEQSLVNLQTPRAAVTTHLMYLQEDQYHPELSARTFSQSFIGEEEAQALAIQLKQVLDGSGIYIDVNKIPDTPNYTDSISNEQRYVLTSRFPDIYLSKQGKHWKYDQASYQAIKLAHEEVFPFGTAVLLELLPKVGTTSFLGLHVWQWFGIFLIALLCIIFYLASKTIFERLIYRLLARYGYKSIAVKHVMPVAKPFSLFVSFSLLIVLLPVLQLPIFLGKYLIMAVRAIVPVFVVLVFYHLVDLISLYFERLAERTEGTLDDQLVKLLRKILKIIIVIAGGLFVLQNLDYNITGLLTGISIGGLAFALAAQDTLKNFFGSMMIFIDKPFQIGDWITSGDIDGTVEEVGFRSTRIRTFRNSVTSVPNGRLADSTVDNHGMRLYRRYATKLSVTYDTPPDLLELFIKGLREIVVQHPETRKDFYEVQVNDLGAHAIEIMFYIFFAVPTWSDELRCRHEIIMSVIRLAHRLGVRFAFPTQTLHVENFPGQHSLSPTYEQDMEKMQQAMHHHLYQTKG